MSQKSQEFSSSLPLSDILPAYLQDELYQNDIYQELGSQSLSTLFNGELCGQFEDDTRIEADLQDDTTMSAEDVKTFHRHPDMMPEFYPSLAADVLSNDEYSGPYDFDVSVLPNYKNPWVYSAVLNKVFMDMNQQFPVDFKIKNRPDKPLYVRTTLQYSAQHYAAEPVSRCIQHDHPSNNADVPDHVRQHVIRCSNKSAKYVGDVKNLERLSIVFQLGEPQVGSESIRELFHFVCKSSCPTPGMNRRAIEVIFQLEDDCAKVLGRKCLKVRVCACPKRDKDKEENEASKNNTAAPRGKKRKTSPSADSGKGQPGQEDLQTYTVNMKFVGKQNLVDILSYSEKVYMAKAYQVQGRAEESAFKSNLAEIQKAKRQLQ